MGKNSPVVFIYLIAFSVLFNRYAKITITFTNLKNVHIKKAEMNIYEYLFKNSGMEKARGKYFSWNCK